MEPQKAIVVGASSGIGREVARLMLKEGWKLGVAARRIEKLQLLKEEFGDQVVTCQLDVTDEHAPETLRHLINQLGGIDLYFHASGIGFQNRDLQSVVELRTMKTNVFGFSQMVGEAFRYFSEHNHGHIAAISSIAGTKGLGPAPAYSATKAFQNNYIQALEQQARQRQLDIAFTDIRPGFVDTALLAGTFHYPMMMKPEYVARHIVAAIKKKKAYCSDRLALQIACPWMEVAAKLYLAQV
jgi:NADP-dependent 3-hydroxy acid dehydrogenase YdfG